MYTTKQKGFTIVELLIVIVVIAILAAISLVAFTGVQQRGRDSGRASDTSNIAKALTASTSEGADWPADAEDARALLGDSNANIKVSNDIITKLTGTAASTSSITSYGYTRCPATGTQTGARITWLKEAEGGAPQTVDAGSGC